MVGPLACRTLSRRHSASVWHPDGPCSCAFSGWPLRPDAVVGFRSWGSSNRGLRCPASVLALDWAQYLGAAACRWCVVFGTLCGGGARFLASRGCLLWVVPHRWGLPVVWASVRCHSPTAIPCRLRCRCRSGPRLHSVQQPSALRPPVPPGGAACVRVRFRPPPAGPCQRS